MKGEADVSLKDGRKLKLCFDANAWVDVEDALGMKFPEILEALGDKENPPSLKMQRAVIWGGLQKHHPEMTVRDAGEILVEAAEAMAKAVGGGLPQPEPEIEEDDEEAEPVAAPNPRRKAGAGTA